MAAGTFRMELFVSIVHGSQSIITIVAMSPTLDATAALVRHCMLITFILFSKLLKMLNNL